MWEFYHRRHEVYLHSERFYWDSFRRQYSLKTLYRWIDELHLNEPSFAYFVREYGSDRLKMVFAEEGSVGKSPSRLFDKALREEWAQARANYLGRDEKVLKSNMYWINP